MEFLNIKNHPEITQNIKKLYKSSFPVDEQVPFIFLSQKAKQPISDLFGIYENEKFIGLVCNVYHKDIVFLWYLAIVEEERNKGYGTKILKEVAERFKDRRIILNIEEVDDKHSDYEKQLIRKQFYLHNGYKECGFKTKEYGVIYEMLYLKEAVSFEEYAEIMIQYSNKHLFEKNYKKI